MAHRRAFPPTIEWVNALNLIDVIFADHTNVVNLWHRYYDELHKKPEQMDPQAREHIYLELLSAIARVLGYKRLQQTDIDKYYSPIAHGNQLEITYKTQKEFLRVLENTSKFETSPRESPRGEGGGLATLEIPTDPGPPAAPR